MTARVSTVNEKADRCELCGASSDGTFSGRTRHLRGTHPAYAQGVLLRIAAPFVLLVAVLIAAALKAPPWGFIIALAAPFAMLFFGRIRSRTERTKAGARQTVPLKRMLKEGALPFLLFPVIVALIILLLGRR